MIQTMEPSMLHDLEGGIEILQAEGSLNNYSTDKFFCQRVTKLESYTHLR